MSCWEARLTWVSPTALAAFPPVMGSPAPETPHVSGLESSSAAASRHPSPADTWELRPRRSTAAADWAGGTIP